MKFQHGITNVTGEEYIQHQVTAMDGATLLTGYVITKGTSKDETIAAFLDLACETWNQTEGETDAETS